MNQSKSLNKRGLLAEEMSSITAEYEVIAAMLKTPELVDSLPVTQEDFTDQRCRETYACMRQMSEKGERIDPVTVAEAFPLNTLMGKEGGGLPWLGELIVNSLGRESGARHYADILRGHTQSRKIAAAGVDIHLLAGERIGLDEKFAKADHILSSLTLGGVESKTTHLQPAMQEYLEEISRRNGAGMPGMSSGIDDLDKLLNGFQPKNLYVIGARPSMGKTSLATGIATHISLLQSSALCEGSHGVLMVSQEMSTNSIIDRLMSSMGSIDLASLIRGELTEDGYDRLSYALSRLMNAAMWINDRSASSLADIRAMLRERRKDNIKLLVIDYLQLMQGPGNTRNEQVENISRGLKQIAKDFNIAVVLLSQLSRKVDERADRRPINSDLRDSGSIEQDADVIMFIYRDEVYKPDTQDKGIAEILVTKNRNGPTGVVRTLWRGEYTRFDPMSAAC